MKSLLPVVIVITGFFLLVTLTTSCSKSTDTAALPKEQLVASRWNINRMQLKLFTGGSFIKDTIIPQTPMPENYIQFNGTGNFEYRFNTAAIDAGTYLLQGADSIIAISATKTYRWKILTLISHLFTMVTTTTTDPAFPGLTVERYYTLVN